MAPASLRVPGAQAVQLVAPWMLDVPAGQTEHVWFSSKYSPLMQAVQRTDAGSLHCPVAHSVQLLEPL